MRQSSLWRRGEPLPQAETIFAAEQTDLTAGGGVDRTPGFERTVIARMIDMHNSETYELRGDEAIRLDTPMTPK